MKIKLKKNNSINNNHRKQCKNERREKSNKFMKKFIKRSIAVRIMSILLIMTLFLLGVAAKCLMFNNQVKASNKMITNEYIKV